MARHDLLSSLLRGMLRPCAFCIKHPRLACLILICAVFLLSAVSAVAQTAQRVYGSTASELSTFSIGSDGTLRTLSGTPFSRPQFQSGAMAIDGLGKFLFVIDPNSSGIWMFSIESDGTLTASPNGPSFAPAPGNAGTAPSSPLSLATERSGQFLFVGYQSGSAPGDGAIITFQIDAQDPANPQLLPVPPSQASNIPGLPVAMLTGPDGANLYVGLSSSQMGGANVYSIDSSGVLALLPNGGTANEKERSIAMDPQGRFFFDGWGSNEGFIESGAISPADGTVTAIGSSIGLGLKNFPQAMFVDSSGRFLYVTVTGGQGTFVYSIDAAGNLTPSPVSPLTAFSFQTGTAAADPQGPYIYSLQPDGVHGFVIDPVAGDLSPLPVAPFSGTSVGVGGLAISGAQVQAVTGPVGQLFPPSQEFGTIPVGQASGTKTLSLTNTGSLPVTLSSVTMMGANAGDFTARSNCSVPAILLSKTSSATCLVSVTFAPAAAGQRQATLTTTDTAGTQNSQLTGTGVGAQSAVTFVPGSLSFPTTMQGATSVTQSVMLTSSGVASLHISSVQLSGSNPGDFAVTSPSCDGTYAVSASCTITVMFSPLADGLRSSSLLITDDAPGSPQSVSLNGTGTGTPAPKPAAKIAPATVSFPATAPGVTSAQQNVTITSSGTAALHFSSVPQLSGTDMSDFSVSSNSCLAPAYAVNTACTIGLTFKPSATGTRTATLTINDDAPGSPQSVAIAGSSNALVSVTPVPGGSFSVSITAGQIAVYNLQLTPGFDGSVSFNCSGAPAAATCTVPAAIKVTSGTTAPFIVTVTTTGSTAFVPPIERVRDIRFPAAQVWIVTTLFCLLIWAGLTLFLTATRAVNGAPCLRMAGVVFRAAFAAFAVCSVAGCGGGSSVAQNAPLTQPLATPPGASTIVVTLAATMSGGTPVTGIAPIQLTLTVN